MVCKHLLLPALAMGLAFYAPATSARNTQLLNSAQLNQQHLHFVENKGQIVNQYREQRPDIDFRLSAGNGLNIFIGSGEIHYQWAKPIEESGHGKPGRTAGHELGASAKGMDAAPAYEMYRMDVALIGANPNATVITGEQQSFYERYYLPTAGANGAIAHAFHKITYKNVYPNIDWVLYVNSNAVEYDFVIRPGGNVSDIKLKYGGATELKTTGGNLIATTPFGSITEKAPYSFQKDGKAIFSKFVLKDNTLSFDVAEYAGTLTIDPTLEWGTYFGGSDDESGRSIATDNNGNVYLAGSTGSLSNIATTGAYQTTYGGGSNINGADAFLSKWDAGGNLLWATYYGGSNVDVAAGVGCDTSGYIYMGGYTKSDSGIATTGSYQDTKAGSPTRYDAFLVKFDTAGQRIWGTYYGGTQNEASTSFALTCDNKDNIYITGNTQSTNGIATTGAYQTTSAGLFDVFLAKFNAAGSLDWATYYGGEGEDYCEGVTTDSAGNIYITGQTLSTTGIATPGGYQTTPGGIEDAFLAKFDTAGQLGWGTYMGGSDYDEGRSVYAMGSGKVYLGGQTISNSGIATTNSFQDTIGGISDAFLASFNNSGQLEWCTYFGGTNSDALTGVWSNNLGDVYISGQTRSTAGISTPGVPQDTLNGYQNLFLAKFSETGQLDWGTYYGGIGGDGLGCMSGRDNFLFLSGYTFSAGIATPNAYQPTLGGGNDDALLIKFNDCDAPAIPDTILGDTLVCSGTTHAYSILPVTGASSYTFIPPSGWSQTTASADSIYLTPNDTSGILKVVAISACGGVSDTQSIQITVLPSPDPEIVNNNNILSTTQSYDSYQWILNGTDIPGANTPTYLPEEDGDYCVRVTNTTGCDGLSDTVSVTGTNGITTVEKKASFSVYPNPAKDYVIITGPCPAEASVIGTGGRVLISHIALREKTNKVALNKLSAGMYWLKIVTDASVQVVRIVIK